MELNFFVNIVLSVLLGGGIGLERDISHSKEPNEHFASMRTFALICVLGAVFNIFDGMYRTGHLFALIGFLTFSLLTISSYLYSSFRLGEIGINTELTAMMTFLIGNMVGQGYHKIAVILTISIIIIVSFKEKIEKLKQSITKEDFRNSLKFAVIAFVILPLLPDEKYSILGLIGGIGVDIPPAGIGLLEMKFFNPYSTWFFVVVISAVGYVGYILSKVMGKHASIMLSSLVGGLVSSTAVTATMSEQSRKDPKNPAIYAMGVLAANSIMLIRVICIILALNIALLGSLWQPALLMLVGFGIVLAYTRYRSMERIKKTELNIEEKIRSPFSLAPALKFGLFILLIKFIAGVGILYKDFFAGDYFYSIFGIISGFADVDAITQTMSLHAKEGTVIPKLAVTAILLAVMSNNVVKASIACRFGDKAFSRLLLLGFGLSIMLGVIGIILS